MGIALRTRIRAQRWAVPTLSKRAEVTGDRWRGTGKAKGLPAGGLLPRRRALAKVSRPVRLPRARLLLKGRYSCQGVASRCVTRCGNTSYVWRRPIARNKSRHWRCTGNRRLGGGTPSRRQRFGTIAVLNALPPLSRAPRTRVLFARRTWRQAPAVFQPTLAVFWGESHGLLYALASR